MKSKSILILVMTFVFIQIRVIAQGPGKYKVIKTASMEWSPKQQTWIKYPWKLVNYNITVTSNELIIENNNEHFKIIKLKGEKNDDKKSEVIFYGMDENKTDCLIHLVMLNITTQYLIFTVEYEDIASYSWIVNSQKLN